MKEVKKLEITWPLKLSYSSISTYCSCPRKHLLSKIYSRDTFNEAFVIGDLVHEVYEIALNHPEIKIEDWVDQKIAHTIEQYQDNPGILEIAYKTAGIMKGAIFGSPYLISMKQESMGQELEFEYPYNDDVIFSGRLDGLQKNNKGVFIREIKTCQDFQSWVGNNSMQGNFQATFYFYAAHAYNLNPVGVIFYLIKKPKIRQTKKENPYDFGLRVHRDMVSRRDFYFAHNVAFRNTDDKYFREMMDSIVGDIVRSYKNYDFGMRPNACYHYKACKFMPICHRDPLWHTYYKEI